MIAQEDIRQLPFSEKLALLETVWTEISGEPEKIEVPEWHKELLSERRRALKQGSIRVLDWEDAKKEIEEAIR